ncbi:asparaginase [Hoyosella sp. YIM 151337]|uniref:asparaginase n=1 Tax=Hoyosella sp. YIM 151337 TaxID=2992742 RepID=UPI002235DA52|nr:asparaginase [Hoyosella sp. YIM 151337]MCW4352143.1 asparaginase [Hoyosella sp. YIM 151337]
MDTEILVEVERNGFVESRHRGSVVVLGADGAVLHQAGDIESPILPRSCMKPLQATGMVRAGLSLAPEPLALACASHSGEERHAALAAKMLADGGLCPADLQCTPDLPLDRDTRHEYLRAGGMPSVLHANCSGKHAAMCLTTRRCGWRLDNYLDLAHPLQQGLIATAEQLSGERISTVTIDGCGAPAFALSLTGLARAYATIASGADDATRSVAAAMRTHPWAVGGEGRPVTRLMREIPGLIAKDGADGVAAAALADGRTVAVKVEDGDLGGRALFRVLSAGLRFLGVDAPVVGDLGVAPIFGGGRPVGVVRSVPC